MEIVNKPDIQVFASEAKTGEILKFPDVLRGWGITLDQTQGKPPLEWMNDAFNRIDLNNLYLLQQGLPAWNSAIKYPVNSIIKHLDKVYLCVKENMNSAPTGNSSDWVLYVKNATTTQKGIVQLTNTIDDSEDKAITPKAFTDMSFGTDQHWQDMSNQRSLGSVYTNTSQKLIFIVVRVAFYVKGTYQVYINGLEVGYANRKTSYDIDSNDPVFFLPVPPGETYLTEGPSGDKTLLKVWELR